MLVNKFVWYLLYASILTRKIQAFLFFSKISYPTAPLKNLSWISKIPFIYLWPFAKSSSNIYNCHFAWFLHKSLTRSMETRSSMHKRRQIALLCSTPSPHPPPFSTQTASRTTIPTTSSTSTNSPQYHFISILNVKTTQP